MTGLGASQIPENARLPEGSNLRKARSVLALTAAPKSLPCREAERDSIAGFVREAVQAGECPPPPTHTHTHAHHYPGMTGSHEFTQEPALP